MGRHAPGYSARGSGPPALDVAVGGLLDEPGRWFRVGLIQVVLPVAALVVLVAVVLAAGLPDGSTALGLYSLLAELLAGAGLWLTARGLASRYGGWRQAFGLAPPGRRDVPIIVRWSLLQLGARVGAIALLAALLPSLAEPHGGNVEGLSDLTVLGTVLFGVSAVVVAPILEETVFRGIILRGLMRRMAFWPAALLSSALFGSLHVMGVAHLAGIPALLVASTVFGLLQCVLVRRTGTLGQAMGVHATSNLLVVVLAVSSGA